MHGNGFLNERKFSIKISLANIEKHVISKYTRHGYFLFLHCANLMEYQISDSEMGDPLFSMCNIFIDPIAKSYLNGLIFNG